MDDMFEESEEQDDLYELPTGGSPLSSTLLSRAKQVSPKRQDVIQKRDALLNAYKLLASQQQYRPMPVNDYPGWIRSSALLSGSTDPTARAFGGAGMAEAKAMLDQLERGQSADVESAKTQAGAAGLDLGFLDQDEKTSLNYLTQARREQTANADLALKLALLQSKLAPTTAKTDPTAAAASLGVPTYNGPDPYDGLDKTGQRQLRMNFEKELEKKKEALDTLSANAQDVQRLLDLNEKVKDDTVSTGKIRGAAKSYFDADFAEIDSIASKLAPKMREPGSGASSDLDVRMFRMANPGVDKPYETNKNIGTAYLQNIKLQQDKVDFMENYLAANGHLRGAQAEWRKYVNANPIFDPASKGEDYRLNPNRADWKDYFGKMSKKGAKLPPYWEYMSEEQKAKFK